MTSPVSGRGHRAAWRRGYLLAAVVAGLALTGCGSEAVTRTDGGAGPSAGVVKGSATGDPAGDEKGPANAGSPVSLPPGDPGLDAPAMADPGTAAPDPHGHGEVRRRVPDAALLASDAVGMALGGSWEAHPASPDECAVADGAVASRTHAYASGDARLLLTVTTHEDVHDADEAVSGLTEQLARCGWTVAPDPRLGSASVSASTADRSLMAVSAEGVGVVLIGSRQVTRPAWRWSSLVDLAVGSSCPAAPDGCH